jgi:hypothetical protein
MDLEIIVEGVLSIKKDVEQMAQNVEKQFTKVGLQISAEAKKRAPVGVSGLLRSRITYEVIKSGPFSMYTRVYDPANTQSGFNYPSAVEYGTKPHWLPWHGGENTWQLWAERKGIPAGALQRAIAIRGTKAHPFLHPAADTVLKSFKWEL